MVVNEPKQESLRAKYGLNIEQLDYNYLRECNNAKIIERILIVLRSGQEGVYPDLIRFAEDRLRAVKPSSSLLCVEQPATPLRSLDADEREKLLTELKEWKDEVSAIDAELKTAPIEAKIGKENQLPPVRGTIEMTTTSPLLTERSEKPAPRISSFDYAGWDKYDVEGELRKLDGSEDSEKPLNPLRVEGSDPAIENQPNTSGLTDAEKMALSLREKQKGNEYFRDGDFTRAAVYYTRSIHVHPTVAAYNNRAQANLKLSKHGSALMDCNYVLRQEPRNVKALLRRGMARQMAKDWLKARQDFEYVLQLEANHPQAKQRLAEVEKSIVNSESNTWKRMVIEEMDSSETTEENNISAGGDAKKLTKTTDNTKERLVRSQKIGPAAEIKTRDIVDPENIGEKITLKTSTPTENPSKVLIEELGSTNISEETEDVSDVCKTCSEQSTKIVPMTALPSSPDLTNTNDATKLGNSTQGAATTQKSTESDTLNPAPPSRDPTPSQQSNNPLLASSSSPDLDPPAGSAGPQRRQWRRFEFMREWRRLRGGSLAPYVALLRSVDPVLLPEMFGAELDAGVLATLIRCVLEVMLTEDGPRLCLQILEQVSAAQRFRVAKLLLDTRDKQRVQQLAERLQRLGADVSLLSSRFCT